MSYHLAGRFIEVCDCVLLCPCWVSELPDDNHCTGLFLWDIDTIDGQPPGPANQSVIDGGPVTGLRVVSVSVHQGRRPVRGAAGQPDGYGGTWTVLIVDDRATPQQHAALVAAFGGKVDGIMSELAEVSGTVVLALPAAIDLAPSGEGWLITVRPDQHGAAALVDVISEPATFPPENDTLTLRHTALDHELGVRAGTEITALKATSLKLNVAALPGGYLEVTGRSGMTGEFVYHHAAIDDDLRAHDRQPTDGKP